MSKRPPKDGEGPSAEEIVAAVWKDLQESGLSINEYLGLPEPPEGQRKHNPLEWVQAELIADREKALELAERAVGAADRAHKQGRRLGDELRRIYEDADEARREKHRQDSARGGKGKQLRCPGVFAFTKRRIAETLAVDETPSFLILLDELPWSDSVASMHLERHGPESSIETYIFRDVYNGEIVENQYKLVSDEEMMAEVGRIKESTFRDYFTDAKAALNDESRRQNTP